METAGKFGIGADGAVDYLADSQGTALNFMVMSKAVASFRKVGAVGEQYLEEIRADVRKRSIHK